MERRHFMLSLSSLLLPSIAHGAKKRVVLFGDSEVVLLTAEFKRLAQAAGWDPYVFPVPGSSVMSWALGQHSEWTKIRKLNPDLVIVSLGANDCCFQMYTLQKAEEGWLQRFLARLDRTPGQKVWAGPPKIGGPAHLPQAIDGLEFFVNLVRKYPVTYLDAREVKVSMWGDLLHPDEKGRLDWAQWLFARLPAP